MNDLMNVAPLLAARSGGKRAYQTPSLISYGSIADFTAGGSGKIQENSACNGSNKTLQNMC